MNTNSFLVGVENPSPIQNSLVTKKVVTNYERVDMSCHIDSWSKIL